MNLIKSIQSSKSNTCTTYITPKWLTDKLGPFDVDIAAAKGSYNKIGRRDNYYGPTGSASCGLAAKLKKSDFVWCNPPFGLRNGMAEFISKVALRNNGILLVPANTQQKWFQNIVIPRAQSLYFIYGAVRFENIFAELRVNLGTGILLAEFGQKARLSKLRSSTLIKGALISGWKYEAPSRPP